MGSGSIRSSTGRSSSSSDVCTRARSSRAPARAWRSVARSCRPTGGGSGWRARSGAVRRSSFDSDDPRPPRTVMRPRRHYAALRLRFPLSLRTSKTVSELHIMLIEDSRADAKIIERALREGDVPHRLTVIPDGRQALDYLFGLLDDRADPAREPD